MNTEAQASGLDTVKLSTAALLLGGAVVAFYWFADQSLLFRVLGLLAVVIMSVAIASQTTVGRSTWVFIGATRNEVRKVVWPTRAETTQTVIAVVFVVILMGVLLWMLDMFLLWAIRLLTGQGG
ncbi:Protein translocase subunit SecE [hydrothermal vent metagenome]|uniref:Protein translocase subunit SecE n=1 Tax=hydrothermal vent metagenome TaxID=652676 RepID=A0A3B0Z5Q8_9ZZZZ